MKTLFKHKATNILKVSQTHVVQQSLDMRRLFYPSILQALENMITTDVSGDTVGIAERTLSKFRWTACIKRNFFEIN